MDDLNEILKEEEALKRVIRKGVQAICDKGGKIYPNICLYVSRSTMDQYNIVEKIFRYMTTESLPMDIESALSTVENELESGYPD